MTPSPLPQGESAGWCAMRSPALSPTLDDRNNEIPHQLGQDGLKFGSRSLDRDLDGIACNASHMMAPAIAPSLLKIKSRPFISMAVSFRERFWLIWLGKRTQWALAV